MEEQEISTKRLAKLVRSANALLKKRNRTINVLNITEIQLCELENGKSTDLLLYKSFFVLTIRRLVPRKIKLKSIPANLPSKERIVEMMNGECEDLSEYHDLVDALLSMPDLLGPTQKKKNKVTKTEKTPKKRQKGWGKDSLKKAASEFSIRSYGRESQITRKEWGSAYRPARY